MYFHGAMAHEDDSQVIHPNFELWLVVFYMRKHYPEPG